MTGSPQPTVLQSITIKQVAASEDFRAFSVSLQLGGCVSLDLRIMLRALLPVSVENLQAVCFKQEPNVQLDSPRPSR
jgi:hypothetical protein